MRYLTTFLFIYFYLFSFLFFQRVLSIYWTGTFPQLEHLTVLVILNKQLGVTVIFHELFPVAYRNRGHCSVVCFFNPRLDNLKALRFFRLIHTKELNDWCCIFPTLALE